MSPPIEQVTYDPHSRTLICRDEWNLAHLIQLKKGLKKTESPETGEFIIDGSEIKQMDSAGAYILCAWLQQKQQLVISLQGFSAAHLELFSLIKENMQINYSLPTPPVSNWVAALGKKVITHFDEFKTYLTMVGQLTDDFFYLLTKPKQIRWKEISGILFTSGYKALPIISLLSFMIGIVVTYQMGLQLKNYGANAYIVDLLGMAILREFGPLLTAIMVAGRTGSAFTAELGIMKINQEIDALNTMGISSGQALLLPRIVGLFVALPLLTIWADVCGVIGGMMTSSNMLDISWSDFIARFPEVVQLKSLLIGIGKAPVFALIVASVGCFQGMQVKGSADSVGENTTRSVVWSIFFILVADALFSVLLSEFKL